MKKTLTAAAALAGAVSLLGLGCGSSGSTTTSATSTTSATVDWANSLCSATTTWKQALKDSASSLKSNPSRDAVSAAATDVRTATETYVSTLSGLGAPQTNAGDQAKSQLDTLSKQLQSGVSTMKDAAAGSAGVVEKVSVVSGTLVEMGNQLDAAFTSLKALDPKGELQQAIQQASSCAPYTA